jgi:hypothetical protein
LAFVIWFRTIEKAPRQLDDSVGSHEGVAWMTASEMGDWYTDEMILHNR